LLIHHPSKIPATFAKPPISLLREKLHQSSSQSGVSIGTGGFYAIPPGKNRSDFIPAVEAVKQDDERE
jgi:hypothetical protein